MWNKSGTAPQDVLELELEAWYQVFWTAIGTSEFSSPKMRERVKDERRSWNTNSNCAGFVMRMVVAGAKRKSSGQPLLCPMRKGNGNCAADCHVANEDGLSGTQIRKSVRGSCVKTTPQMTRFRDAKVCNNLATDEIDDHRIQSDYKCISGLQNPKGKNSTLGIASAW